MSKKRGNRRRNRGFARSFTQGVQVCKGTELIVLVNAGSSGSLGLNPTDALFTRLPSLADNFTLFRFVKAVVQFKAPSTTISAACGYVQGTVQTVPTTQANIMTLEPAVLNQVAQTTNSYLRLSRRTLISEGANKWYKVGLGTDSDTQGEIQGYVAAGCSSTTTMQAIFKYVIEFTGDCVSSAVPLPRMIKRVLLFNDEEQERIYYALQEERARKVRALLALQGALPLDVSAVKPPPASPIH